MDNVQLAIAKEKLVIDKLQRLVDIVQLVTAKKKFAIDKTKFAMDTNKKVYDRCAV
jgi:hypothetical protein